MFAWLPFFGVVKEQETARLAAAEDHMLVSFGTFAFRFLFPFQGGRESQTCSGGLLVTFSSSEDLCFFDVYLRRKLLRRRRRTVGVIWHVCLAFFL